MALEAGERALGWVAICGCRKKAAAARVRPGGGLVEKDQGLGFF
jgi:hypothetical protein